MKSSPLTLNELLNYSLLFFNLTMEELSSPCRKRELMDARWMIMLAVKKYFPKMTKTKITAIFNRDHATFIHGESKFLWLIKNDLIMKELYDQYIEFIDRNNSPQWPALTASGKLCFSL